MILVVIIKAITVTIAYSIFLFLCTVFFLILVNEALTAIDENYNTKFHVLYSQLIEKGIHKIIDYTLIPLINVVKWIYDTTKQDPTTEETQDSYTTQQIQRLNKYLCDKYLPTQKDTGTN